MIAIARCDAFERTLGMASFEGRDFLLQETKSCQREHTFVTTLGSSFTFVQREFINLSNANFVNVGVLCYRWVSFAVNP